MKSLSLKWKILIPLLLILIATLLEISLIISMNNAQTISATQINVAGRQRMLSQKMSKEIFGAIFAGSQDYKDNLVKTVGLFEASFKALQEGGSLQVSGRETRVEKTNDTQIADKLKEASSYWGSVRHLIDDTQSGKLTATPETASEINKSFLGVLERFDKITGMYENANTAMVQRSMAIIYACLVGFVLLTAITYFITNQYIIRPIIALKETANEIANGNLGADLEI